MPVHSVCVPLALPACLSAALWCELADMKELSESPLLLWPLSGWGASGAGWRKKKKKKERVWVVAATTPSCSRSNHRHGGGSLSSLTLRSCFYVRDGDVQQPPSSPDTSLQTNSSTEIKDVMAPAHMKRLHSQTYHTFMKCIVGVSFQAFYYETEQAACTRTVSWPCSRWKLLIHCRLMSSQIELWWIRNCDNEAFEERERC